MPAKRYHDLDALRAIAMLLGVLLHACMFLGVEFMTPNKGLAVPGFVQAAVGATGASLPDQINPYQTLMASIHGFRMPLFFVVSGFFTAMLWRKRGAWALIKHRAKRILVPLLVCLPLIWGAFMAFGFLGVVVAGILQMQIPGIWSAAGRGDLKGVASALDSGTGVDQKGQLETTAMHAAARAGHEDIVELLLGRGADPNEPDSQGMTPLMFAAMHGHPEAARQLVSYGADVERKAYDGTSVRGYLEKNFEAFIDARLMGLLLDWDRIREGRAEVKKILDGSDEIEKQVPLKKEDSSDERSQSKREIEPGPLLDFAYQVFPPIERFEDLEIKKPEATGASASGMIDLRLAGRREYFAMEFSGDLEIPESGEYRFDLGSDDGSRLYINDKQVIDNGLYHALEFRSGKVQLESGPARIRVQYLQGMGDATLVLRVSGPGISELLLTRDDDAKKVDVGGLFERIVAEMPPGLGAFVGVSRKWAQGESAAHLWFLRDLVFLVIAFLVAVSAMKLIGLKSIPSWLVTSHACWLWILPCTLVLQLVMTSYGPDTAAGFIPWPPLLMYYAIFFFFGAMCFGQPGFEEKLGRHWIGGLLICIPLFVLGFAWMNTRNELFGLGFDAHRGEILRSHLVTTVLQVVYCWVMIFASIGFFRRFFSNENATMRFVSDSSYWVYIAHLPLLIFVSPIVALTGWHASVRLLLASIVTSAILFLVYKTHIRHTYFGTMLNGPRRRSPHPEESSRNRLVAAIFWVFGATIGLPYLYAQRYRGFLVRITPLFCVLAWIAFGASPLLALAALLIPAWSVGDILKILSGDFTDGSGKRIFKWA